ncbi:hypothetical protein BV25DRAFT_1834508 [Artomyces pyxidatus]|uniref:Uncharacterized protein n=1 Tax=Artomyces pyxidatus TaxID=48021 RepID=A0ACB8TII2_9AGAM|nr:hypothetical protein BV25DRAFT_1834508 [Artomyces pyxidatus]
MGNNYVFSLQPTFTQGLLLGQLSILTLLAVILKYLFLDTAAQRVSERSSHRLRSERDASVTKDPPVSSADGEKGSERVSESTEWFNAMLQQVAETYRLKLRDDLQGPEGDEILRQRIEDFANKVRPAGSLCSLQDLIQVHSVNLGNSAPRLSNARSRLANLGQDVRQSEIEFDLEYTDTVSVSLSTAYLFNYPTVGFARLPVSVTISLSVFSCSIILTPPVPSSPAPAINISIPPSFTLDLKTTSLLGSRAKLADVPKLHELIETQLRRALIQRGTWKVVLPALSDVAEATEEVQEEISLSLQL